jgi:hypothetical protein
MFISIKKVINMNLVILLVVHANMGEMEYKIIAQNVP